MTKPLDVRKLYEMAGMPKLKRAPTFYWFATMVKRRVAGGLFSTPQCQSPFAVT